MSAPEGCHASPLTSGFKLAEAQSGPRPHESARQQSPDALCPPLAMLRICDRDRVPVPCADGQKLARAPGRRTGIYAGRDLSRQGGEPGGAALRAARIRWPRLSQHAKAFVTKPVNLDDFMATGPECRLLLPRHRCDSAPPHCRRQLSSGRPQVQNPVSGSSTGRGITGRQQHVAHGATAVGASR